MAGLTPSQVDRRRAEGFAFPARALDAGRDRALAPPRRMFFYLLFEHGGDLVDQPWGPEGVRSAERHLEIVARFGRVSPRDAALGREATPEEARFLTEPNSSF